jgi:CheY-like chemotaxis protein
MPARKPPAVPRDDRPLVVLVVEDEPANRLLLQMVVEDVLGGRAMLAVDGDEALAAVAREAPDVILLDLMLPGVDGFAVATRLKGDPQTAHVPIVAVSALARREDEQAARQAGCDAFLLKPFELADVERVIRTLVPGKQPGATPPAQNQ